MVAFECVASGSWRSLVTACGGIAVVHTSCLLQEIARRRRHVAQLRRCAGEQGLRQHRIPGLHCLVVCDVGVACEGADLQPTVRGRFDGGEIERIDVDELCRLLDVDLHVIDQVRAAGDEADVRPLLSGVRACMRLDRIVDRARRDEIECVHRVLTPCRALLARLRGCWGRPRSDRCCRSLPREPRRRFRPTALSASRRPT